MDPKISYYIFACLFILPVLFVPCTTAQVLPSDIEYSHNHLPWFTIEGEHFLVHYQEGSETTAAAASMIAHQVYKPITDLYRFKPRKKVSVILRDREDYSNGAAYFFDDKIDIWIPPLDTPFRGTHHWLRNVITHEFTHIVQMGASMRRSEMIPSVYLQWLSYEDVRRPDVLYGSPNGIVSHPFSTVNVPAWFSEGTAQFMRETIFYDYWDSHRDMILRMAVLHENALSLDEMGHFSSKNSLEREMVYNQGFDFTRYLTESFGEDIISRLSIASSERNNNFKKVMETVTGVDGEELYNDWIQNRTEKYAGQTENRKITQTESVEEQGFLNFYPQYNPQRSMFGYLTNRGRDYSTTKLILKSADSTITVNQHIQPNFNDSPGREHFSALFDQSETAIDYVGNRFSFSPDGGKVLYSKSDKNKYGEEYSDIYIFDIATEKHEKITASARMHDPAWHPSGNKIAAVALRNGTQNLVLLNLDSGEQTQLTRFRNGETVYTPAWAPDGQQIYFSSASAHTRNLYQYDVNSKNGTPLFKDNQIDFRDPWMNSSGTYLYFSADADGIFNIYRKKANGNTVQQLTDVAGGAFMPFAAKDSLYFSEYTSGGYKISAISVSETDEFKQLNELNSRKDNQGEEKISDTSAYEETESFAAIHDSLQINNSREGVAVNIIPSDTLSYIWRPYRQTTTGLSVIPVIRFDNYSKLHGSNSSLLNNGEFGDVGKNLVRDFKAGAYFSSRDVTENLSIFAGALFGWGSLEAKSLTDFFSPNRLYNLDRDLFFIIDHRGIPFIKRSWSPTISVEVYNLARNVRDGVGIEEFPCTSCFPVQKSIDVRYNVWEANLYLRSKLNRWSLLELGASYSPYSVTTDGFFSDEFREFIPGSTTEYFNGSSYSASYIADGILPSRHRDVAPEGIRAVTTFRIENGRLLDEFEIDEGTLSPVYSRKTNYSFEMKNKVGTPLVGNLHGVFTSRGFTYLNNPEEYFYLDYAGGLSGMRSYPYFAIGGQRTFWSRFSLLAPLKTGIDKQVGAYTFDKLYAHLFFETGNGWGGPLDIGDYLKTGAGAELRFALNSYYLFPLKLFINTTYGFNRFNVTLPTQFISTSSKNSINYGRELLFYFGLTFDFSQL